MKILGFLLSFCTLTWASELPLNCPYRDLQDSTLISYHYLLTDVDNLDPIQNYEWEKSVLISQIYEPLFTVAYLSSPPKLIPLMATTFPEVTFFDDKMQELPKQSNERPAYTKYTITIRPNIYYQPHHGFCDVLTIKDCSSFKRELCAEDFAYQIKRIAQSDARSPFASVCAKYILGFEDYQIIQQAKPSAWHDLRQDTIRGVKVLGPYTLEIITKGYYQQWLYWMSMSFFSPMPWEIDKHNHQVKSSSPWKQYSIGTGPYMLSGIHQFQKVELVKNPNYRQEYFKFADGVKKIPIIDKFIFNVDVEHTPRWNKFLQGYYDYSSVPSESFENNIQVQPDGKFMLSDVLEKKDISLVSDSATSTNGIVFNFLDPVVGGYKPSQQKLRQAISLAFDFDEFRTIFRNGRGELAQGPIPPEIMPKALQNINFNHVLYQKIRGKKVKKNIQVAKKLLAQAGYPNGVNPKTGRPLIINFVQVSKGLPEERAVFNWFRKQLSKLGIQLNIREYDDNRYRNKMLSGQFQMAFTAWGADYPDPENFLMLFYGSNRQAQLGGPNLGNFSSPRYDKLYETYKLMQQGPKRDALLHEMISLLQQQAVWIWGMHGDNFYLLHHWLIAHQFWGYTSGLFKYYELNPKERLSYWQAFNRPEFKPFLYFLLGMVVIILPFVLEQYRSKHRIAKRTSF